jgi:hypothetical protein
MRRNLVPTFILLIFIAVAIPACEDFDFLDFVGVKGEPGSDGKGGETGRPGRDGLEGAPGTDLLPCGPPCIDADSFKNNSVRKEHIVNRSVESAHIGLGVVDTNQIADNAVTALKIRDGSVTSSKIADEAVDRNILALQSVGENQIALGAVGPNNIAPLSVENCALKENSIQAGAFDFQAIGTPELADRSVDGFNIKSDSLAAGHFNTGAHHVVWFKKAPATTEESTANNAFTKLAETTVTLSVPAAGSSYLIMFDSSFHSDRAIFTDGQVRLVKETVPGGAKEILNTKILPSAHHAAANITCGNSDVSHDHRSAQLLGSVGMHWAGEISPGTYDIYVEWRASNTTIRQDPRNNGDGSRTVSIIEFANTETERF